MTEETNSVERVIGLDSHPDSFTAAILRGPTPAAAVVEKVFNKLPMSQLQHWAQKHATELDASAFHGRLGRSGCTPAEPVPSKPSGCEAGTSPIGWQLVPASQLGRAAKNENASALTLTFSGRG